MVRVDLVLLKCWFYKVEKACGVTWNWMQKQQQLRHSRLKAAEFVKLHTHIINLYYDSLGHTACISLQLCLVKAVHCIFCSSLGPISSQIPFPNYHSFIHSFKQNCIECQFIGQATKWTLDYSNRQDKRTFMNGVSILLGKARDRGNQVIPDHYSC